MPFADAKIHSELAAARLRSGVQVERFLQSGVHFGVCVQGGFLDGLSSESYARKFAVGASLESDIVLFDDGIQDRHVEMVFKSSVFGPVMSVRALDAGVKVDSDKLDSGKTSQFKVLPQVVHINDIALKIEPQQSEAKPYNPVIVQAWHYCRYPILALVFLMVGVQLFDHPNFNFQIAMSQDQSQYDIVQRNDVEMKRLAVATTSVKEKLNELGLADFVSASMDTSGAVGVTGTLRSDKQAAWEQFRRWYDENEAPVLLSRVTMAPNLSEFPAIASVKLTSPKMINLQNGTQVGIGDIMHDGLRLTEVHNGYLVLNDHGEDVIISFDSEETNDG